MRSKHQLQSRGNFQGLELDNVSEDNYRAKICVDGGRTWTVRSCERKSLGSDDLQERIRKEMLRVEPNDTATSVSDADR